jgi:capsid protein
MAYDDVWFNQATVERRISKLDKRGNEVRSWVKPPGARNEAFDCRVYAYAALLGLKTERRLVLARRPAADGLDRMAGETPPPKISNETPPAPDKSPEPEKPKKAPPPRGALHIKGRQVTHPGDGLSAGYNTLLEIPAEEVLHVFEPLRPGQLRGVPVLAPVLSRLKSLDEFDDAVLFRQEIANLFAGFVREPAPESQAVDGNGNVIEDDPDFTPMVGLEPGTMQKLRPGEEVEFSTPPDAGNSYPDFMRQQLLAVAAGVGLPFEILTGDLREVNDRLIRAVLNEFHRRIEQRQWSVFIHQFCQPVRAAWLDAAFHAGAIALPDYGNQRRAYLRTRWVPQGWRYIHPVQDIQAQILAIKAGISSRSEAILERGYDAEVIDAEIADDKERAERLGLLFNTDSGNRTRRAGQQTGDKQ